MKNLIQKYRKVLITDEQNDSQILLPTATATVNSPVTVTSITASSTPTTSSTPATSVSSYPSTSTAATSSRDDTQGKRNVMINIQCYHQVALN